MKIVLYRSARRLRQLKQTVKPDTVLLKSLVANEVRIILSEVDDGADNFQINTIYLRAVNAHFNKRQQVIRIIV